MMKLNLIVLTSAMMISNGIAVESQEEAPRRQSTLSDLSKDVIVQDN